MYMVLRLVKVDALREWGVDRNRKGLELSSEKLTTGTKVEKSH